MKKYALALIVVSVFSVSAFADLTFYGPADKAAFEASNTISIVETFSSVFPKDTPLPSFISQGVTYTGIGGTPYGNVWVTGDAFAYNNFGVPVVPAGTNVLTANGNEDFIVDLTSVGPITAIGFDTYLNLYGPVTITVVNDDGATSIPFIHDPATIGFFGVDSSSPISSIQWTAIGGQYINTGIDNVQIGVVPVPGAVLLGMIGLSVAGVKLRKRV